MMSFPCTCTLYVQLELVSINIQIAVDESLAFTETCLDTKFYISVFPKYTSSTRWSMYKQRNMYNTTIDLENESKNKCMANRFLHSSKYIHKQ